MSRHRPGLRISAAAAVLAVSSLALLAQTGGDQRYALVVGNTDYVTGRLNNPANDARDVAAALAGLGFEVDLLQDAGHQAMEDAIRAFGRHLRSGEVGLFYFAGHGVQVGGQNFLVPVGARIAGEREIPYKSVDLRYVLDHMGEAPDRLNIVILDACRDNPFHGTVARSFAAVPQGLAETQAPTGTIIAYATAPGQVADDGSGRNGIFTRHLLEALGVPGLTIEEVFKRTRQGVVKATGGRQVPWTSSSLLGDFVPRPEPPGREDIRVARMESPGPREVPWHPPAPPSANGFSLHELDDKALAFEESQKSWAEHLGDMQEAFREVDRYEERNMPAQLKVEAWELFLANFDDNNPFTRADDSLRAEAASRRDLWRREAERVAAGLRPVEVRPVPEQPAPDPGSLWREPATGMRFRYVPAGRFTMGSPRFEVGRDCDEILHEVSLSRGFWMAENEVTQGEWRRVLGNNPSYFDSCDDCPVERVSWYEAAAYANLLSRSAGLEGCYELSGCRGALGGGCSSGHSWCFGDFVCMDVWYKGPSCEGFRLPTEAEWEHAARAGTETAYWTGDFLSLNQANVYENRYERLRYNHSGTTEVGSFGANPWGLSDVHGNVLEWVWDWFARYPSSPAEDPEGPWDGAQRVARGGGWKDPAELCRSATRRRIDPGNRFDDVGFRLVRSGR